ncbi:PE-PPE domain-containing protein [[Mycobacterium] kokjensenii]|uniref:PE-PPE domain-containing protein n=1 Tax=[Mycobacterium] kokjensenii TaxID=3064287 RepID=A0ABM9LX65_9MYCO|nr:PE-PPE domain-containing protein [Mycolicibacter sp. MU0083]CAJ1506204.1 PE-PPE domain-containing protein [Mycolicibacter sp. MU0083]
MHYARNLCSAAAVAALGSVLIAPVAPAAPTPAAAAPEVSLAATESLGGGTAFIIGGSGLATPGPSYVDAVLKLYLEPLGFTGTTQVVTTPEQLYPFLGPFGGTLDESVVQGQQNLYEAIMAAYDNGDVTAENPAVVFGWSQGAIIETMLQFQLADEGIPSDLVHFVMVGDVNAPNGGMLERFLLPDISNPTLPSLGLTFSGAGASDLYPTAVYTHEYDGFADFPQYPINFLAVLNAILGIAFQHTTYLGLTEDQIADAILLPTADPDGLTDYYMIPAAGLPLLYPLLFFGNGGQALYDLLEPVTRILVNLGYGNLEHGWSQGPADVPTPLGFLPDSDTLDELLKELPQALSNAAQQGISNFFDTIFDPDDTPPAFLAQMEGFIDAISDSGLAEFLSTFPTMDDLFNTFPPHTGIPFVDVGTALLFNLPQINYEIFAGQLADGNLLDAIGLPLALDVGILPLALLGAII